MADVPPSSAKRPLYKQLLRPSWLAGIISVGFHGALFAAGPTFSDLAFNELVEPELEAEKRNVPLVELSAAEQARLPDFSSPLYNFDTFGELEPLSPLFSDDEFSSSGSSDSSIALTDPVPSPLTRSRPLPTPSYRIPFGITNLEPRSRTTPPSAQSGLGQSPDKPNTAANSPSGTNNAAGRNGANGSAVVPGAGSADDLGGTSTSADDLNNAEGTAIAAGSPPTEVMSLEERLRAYTYDIAGTDPEAATEQFDEWIAAGRTFAEELAIADQFIIPENIDLTDAGTAAATDAPDEDAEAAAEDSTDDSIVRAPIELPIDHEQRFCLAKPPQKGLIGAWVSPEGELLGEPEIIRSTGYAGLNQQAVRQIQTLDFSSVDRFTGYQFEVVVNYDPENCVNIGGSPSESEDEAVASDRENGDATDKTPAKTPTPAGNQSAPSPDSTEEPSNQGSTPDSQESSEPAAPESSSEDAE